MNALDNILTAMKNLRIFERFGFDLPIDSNNKPIKITPLFEYNEWPYLSSQYDWINLETDETPSGYKLPSELKVL